MVEHPDGGDEDQKVGCRERRLTSISGQSETSFAFLRTTSPRHPSFRRWVAATTRSIFKVCSEHAYVEICTSIQEWRDELKSGTGHAILELRNDLETSVSLAVGGDRATPSKFNSKFLQFIQTYGIQLSNLRYYYHSKRENRISTD